MVIEPVDGFAPAAPVPAAKLEENVKPLTGLRQVTVNWPAVPVGAAQTPMNSALIALTKRCASVDTVSFGYTAAPKDVPPTVKKIASPSPNRDPRLNPLEPAEAIGYIETRLARAGLPDQKIFSPELLEEIYKRARGIPRVINLICDNLLVTAFAMERKKCTLEMLDEVCQDLRLEWPGSNRDRRGTRSRYGMEEDHFPDSIAARGD